MKKLMTLVVLLTALFTLQVNAEILIFVDSEYLEFKDQDPILDSNGRTLVPVRTPSEAFGANVKWDNKLQKATIELKDKVVEIFIGKKDYLVNNKKLSMDTTAEVINGRTMVPLRFISEALGVDVKWDKKGNEAYIRMYTPEKAIPAWARTMIDNIEKPTGFVKIVPHAIVRDRPSGTYYCGDRIYRLGKECAEQLLTISTMEKEDWLLDVNDIINKGKYKNDWLQKDYPTLLAKFPQHGTFYSTCEDAYFKEGEYFKLYGAVEFEDGTRKPLTILFGIFDSNVGYIGVR